MTRQIGVVLYALAMIAVVVSLDILFLQDRFWARLIVNVAVVLAFGAVYLTFLKSRSRS